MSSERRKRLWSQLDNKKVDALLITSGETIRYITGFTGSESVLLVSRRGGCLIVDSRYTSQARLECKRMAIKESRNKFKGFVAAAAQRGFKKIGFDPHQLTVSHYRELKKEGTFGLVELAENIEAIRSVKDAGELKLLKKAADISSNSFLDVLDEIRPGVREEAIALSLEYKIKKNGAETTPFPLIVTSGKRGALPHGLATDKKVRKGEFVTVDFGAVYKGYCSDETCTVVIGKPAKKQKMVYQAVKEAHDKAMNAVRPGMKAHAIDVVARDVLEQAGLGHYFGHGTGHGVGLAVHEEPRIAPHQEAIIEKDMVFTIEPGVYIPGWGGVRIEDTVRVTRGGCEPVSSVSKELYCI
jgi:Xaa-Pro aminopeptidase